MLFHQSVSVLAAMFALEKAMPIQNICIFLGLGGIFSPEKVGRTVLRSGTAFCFGRSDQHTETGGERERVQQY